MRHIGGSNLAMVFFAFCLLPFTSSAGAGAEEKSVQAQALKESDDALTSGTDGRLSVKAAGGHPALPDCEMDPPYLEIRLSDHGFTRLPVEQHEDPCEAIEQQKWIRKSSGPFDLFVYPDGPSGSGRYWSVTVGIADGNDLEPIRGFCLETSTVGFRTLQSYKRTPLPWLDDLDNDGKLEILIWSSFPISKEQDYSGPNGLVAWVYRMVSKNSLVIDWPLTRMIAREIAQEYRSRKQSMGSSLLQVRAAAADDLEKFADKKCISRQDDAR